VAFRNAVRNLNRNYKSIKNQLVVSQILPAVYDGIDFPGYDSVRLTFYELESIIDRHKIDWVNALSNQKAVYLLTDMYTGDQYVGSATSAKGELYQRWADYARNGHGGDVALIDLVKREGFDYIKKNFQFSILENYNKRVPDEEILARENWWKITLGTRTFGLNKN